MNEQCKHHVAHEQALQNDKSRLDMHGREIDRISVILERLTVLQETSNKRLEQVEKVTGNLQAAPGKKWEQVTMYIVLAVVGMMAGIIASRLGL